MLAVQSYYEKLNFYDIFSKHKSKGLDLNSLLIGLVSYKLTENFSIKEAGNWLNQKDEMEYLTSMKLNTSDDKIIEKFDPEKAELIDAKKGLYGIKIVKPSSIKYFYFSEALQKRQLEAKARAIMRKLKEAREIQKAIVNKKKLPKKFRINNELIEIDYSFRTKLEELSDEEAIELLKASLINGREGFFCLKSNKDLTLEEALKIYRKKDSIEKIFHSLKNEIQIKPLRV